MRALAVAAALLVAAPAAAAPLALSLGASEGIVTDGTIGVVRDDAQLSLRLLVGIGRRVALELGGDADVERLELSARAGVRVRPWVGRRWSPYLRGDVAVVGATRLGDDWELSTGVGMWLRLSRWAGAFAEVDVVARVGALRSLADHAVIGVALTAPSFWR